VREGKKKGKRHLNNGVKKSMDLMENSQQNSVEPHKINLNNDS